MIENDQTAEFLAEVGRRGWSATPRMPDSRPLSWGYVVRRPEQPRTRWIAWHDGHATSENTIYIECPRRREWYAASESAAEACDWIEAGVAGVRSCDYCWRHPASEPCARRPADA